MNDTGTPLEVPRNRALQHLGPRDAVDGAHHANLDGREAHLDDTARIDDAFRPQRLHWKPEGRDGIDDAATVLDGWRDVDVEVARESRRAMERKRVRTDDHELNVMGVQSFAELCEVGPRFQATAF